MKDSNECRKMTIDEVFEENRQYFELYNDLFDDQAYIFLRSIMSYGEDITYRQKVAFNRTVSIVRECQNRKRKTQMWVN